MMIAVMSTEQGEMRPKSFHYLLTLATIYDIHCHSSFEPDDKSTRLLPPYHLEEYTAGGLSKKEEEEPHGISKSRLSIFSTALGFKTLPKGM